MQQKKKIMQVNEMEQILSKLNYLIQITDKKREGEKFLPFKNNLLRNKRTKTIRINSDAYDLAKIASNVINISISTYINEALAEKLHNDLLLGIIEN